MTILTGLQGSSIFFQRPRAGHHNTPRFTTVQHSRDQRKKSHGRDAENAEVVAGNVPRSGVLSVRRWPRCAGRAQEEADPGYRAKVVDYGRCWCKNFWVSLRSMA